jgi:hypothetical protein
VNHQVRVGVAAVIFREGRILLELKDDESKERIVFSVA